eukprot:Skav203870  [mRNA]  locus=scaffold1031:162237:162478:+ [translate_table: standard]
MATCCFRAAPTGLAGRNSPGRSTYSKTAIGVVPQVHHTRDVEVSVFVSRHHSLVKDLPGLRRCQHALHQTIVVS